MAEPTDPITQTHQDLWAALTGWRGWSELVKPGNRIDTTAAGFENFRDDPMAGNLPEAMLLQGKFTLKPFGSNSQSSDITQAFVLYLTTDLLKVVQLNQVKYHTLVALLKAGEPLSARNLVRSLDLTDGVDSFGDAGPLKELARGARRWVAALSINATIALNRNALLALR